MMHGGVPKINGGGPVLLGQHIESIDRKVSAIPKSKKTLSETLFFQLDVGRPSEEGADWHCRSG